MIGNYILYDGSVDNYDLRTKDGKFDLKIIVLINGNTCGEAEYLAKALQERENVLLVGQRTYGQGRVAGVYSLGDEGAGYQLTIAEFVSPNKQKIDGVGVDPDVLVEGDVIDMEEDQQLQKAIELMVEQLTVK